MKNPYPINPSAPDKVDKTSLPAVAKPVVYKAMTRKQIALALGISTKTLAKWCENAGLKLPKYELILPRMVKRIFEELDPNYTE